MKNIIDKILSLYFKSSSSMFLDLKSVYLNIHEVNFYSNDCNTLHHRNVFSNLKYHLVYDLDTGIRNVFDRSTRFIYLFKGIHMIVNIVFFFLNACNIFFFIYKRDLLSCKCIIVRKSERNESSIILVSTMMCTYYYYFYFFL